MSVSGTNKGERKEYRLRDTYSSGDGSHKGEDRYGLHCGLSLVSDSCCELVIAFYNTISSKRTGVYSVDLSGTVMVIKV